jgi:hypothetical protein
MFPAIIFITLKITSGCLGYFLYVSPIVSTFLKINGGFHLKIISDIRNRTFVAVLSVILNHEL